MGDNDFPAVMGNTPIGFVQQYLQGMNQYQQSGTGVPDFETKTNYAQERGGPLVAGVSFDINESPANRRLRNIKKLSEGSTGGEKAAADAMLKKFSSGIQLPKV